MKVESFIISEILSLKNNYPNPMILPEERAESDTYCVAGAYLLSLGINHPFPDPVTLYRAIVDLTLTKSCIIVNNESYLSYIYSLSEAIIEYNDKGWFDMAWNTLDATLAFIKNPSFYPIDQLDKLIEESL